MRRREPRPLALALESLEERLAPRTLLAEVQRAWPTVTGPAVAEVAEPVAERSGVVTVACRSAVWAQELDLMSERIVAGLNEALERPAVQRLRVQARPPSG